jgi:hypothetical protein
MKKDVNQEIIIHKNQSSIFDIIGEEEDNNVKKVKEFNILEFDRDKFSNFDLIQFGKNQYIAVEFGFKYDLSKVSLYLKTSDKRFVSHDTSEHNSFYEFIRISQPEVKETNEAVYGSFLFDTGLAIVKKIDHEFDEDEVDTSSFKEMFEAMSKL